MENNRWFNECTIGFKEHSATVLDGQNEGMMEVVFLPLL